MDLYNCGHVCWFLTLSAMSLRIWLIHAPVTGPTPRILARLCPGGWREPQKPWSRRSSREETGPLPSAGSWRNSTQIESQSGKCKIPGVPGEEVGEGSRGRRLWSCSSKDRYISLKPDWLYSLQLKMEKLYTISKNKTWSWLWLRSWAPYCKIQT